MARIDSHQHFWLFDPARDNWIDGTMEAIRQDFMPADLLPILERHRIDGCITVQSDQSEDENIFQLENAGGHAFIKGVVGWVDLRAAGIEERLQHYAAFRAMKGFRHVLQGEPNRRLMLDPAFMNGISRLAKYGFTYDLLVFPDQLGYSTELAGNFPDQPFMLDHIAKPYIKKKEIAGWEKDLRALAANQNVFCKVSGIITEANWDSWTPGELKPYLDVVFDAFGTDRVLFGSDWPVCQLAGGYDRVVSLMENYLEGFSENERELFWGGNAGRFYGIK